MIRQRENTIFPKKSCKFTNNKEKETMEGHVPLRFVWTWYFKKTLKNHEEKGIFAVSFVMTLQKVEHYGSPRRCFFNILPKDIGDVSIYFSTVFNPYLSFS